MQLLKCFLLRLARGEFNNWKKSWLHPAHINRGPMIHYADMGGKLA